MRYYPPIYLNNYFPTYLLNHQFILLSLSVITELDILNLIRIQGNSLTLEIFRRHTRTGSTKSKVFSPKLVSGRMSFNQDMSTDDENSVKPSNIPKSQVHPPSTLAVTNSNVSLENTKRRLRLPQVTGATSKEVRKNHLRDYVKMNKSINYSSHTFHLSSSVNYHNKSKSREPKETLSHSINES